jgi:hypothetical protein
MPPRRPLAPQPDLLDWQPPEPVVRFEEVLVRASTPAARISKGVAQALKDCVESRAFIAKRMSAILGEEVSSHMLDAYASEARAGHKISIVRLLALIQATGDRRLLEMLAEPFGWAVIERKHLPLIQIAAVREQEDELRRTREMLTRQARAGGAL